MKKTLEIGIREALPEDAEELLLLLAQIRQESDYLTMDETDTAVSIQEQEGHLATIYQSPNNLLLLAFDKDKMIGSASVHADNHRRIEHIGDIGISILKEYWNSGLGSLLMDEIIQWAKESKGIKRLQLTVQDRNKRAIHVYEKKGFKTECVMKRGAKSESGVLLDVHLMSLLIN